MNKRNIEESIKQSIALDTPDLFDKIASTPVQKLSEEDYIVKERPKYNTSKLHLLYTACTSLAILFAICFGLAHNYYSVDSIVAIDVNPSVEIALNKSYKVLSVKANNEDGAALIQGKNFKGKNFDEVVSELTVSLSSEGYIDKDKNSILVSVSNSNEVKANEVKTRVVTDIKTTLNEQEIEPVIYNQSVSKTNTEALEELAEQYHTSFGKMQLIHSLIEKDSSLTIEELVALPIQEIPDYVEKRQIKMADVIECDEGTTAVASNESNNTEAITTITTTEATASSEDTVIPKEERTEAVPFSSSQSDEASINSTEITPMVPTTSSTESSEVVVPKYCPNCPEDCSCSNCKTNGGCQKDCPNCPASCPNHKGNNNNGTTSTETPSKPNKNPGNNTDNGYEITEPDDIETSGSTTEPEDIETSGSTTKPEDILTPPDSSHEEDDLNTSSDTKEPEDIVIPSTESTEELPSISNQNKTE